MVPVESTDDFYRAVRDGRPLVACFQADWCGDCHALKPSYPDLEGRYAGRADFVSVDIDAHPDIARAHEVGGIPSFILFAGGKEVFRFVNPRRKTKEEVTDFLDKGLALVPRFKEYT